MRCIPACKRCREAGSCDQPQLPASPVVITGTEPYRAFKPIDLPHMPNGIARLMCGCVTTREMQLLYSVFRPHGTLKFWCPKHGDWFDAVTPKPVVLPDDPSELF